MRLQTTIWKTFVPSVSVMDGINVTIVLCRETPQGPLEVLEVLRRNCSAVIIPSNTDQSDGFLLLSAANEASGSQSVGKSSRSSPSPTSPGSRRSLKVRVIDGLVLRVVDVSSQGVLSLVGFGLFLNPLLSLTPQVSLILVFKPLYEFLFPYFTCLLFFNQTVHISYFSRCLLVELPPQT